MQAALLATIAHVTPRQHAPVVIGHGAGVQLVPLPRNVPVQPVRTATVHAPLVAQHAPPGTGQTTPVHVVVPVCTVPGQSAAMTTVQVPSEAQHALLGDTTHGVGVQATPTCQLEMPAQLE